MSELQESSELGLNFVADDLQLDPRLGEMRPLMSEEKVSFESENDPLGLLINDKSIEKRFPLPQIMLSHSEDAYRPQNRQYQQKQKQKLEDLVPNQLRNIIDFSFVDGVDLKKLIYLDTFDSKSKDDNKNTLRNFGSAQNHYILYHHRARKRIKLNIEDAKQFDSWVRSLKLENFEQFKKAWRDSNRKLFTRLYRELCWQFYTQNAIPYVISSRIKKVETRMSHLRQIHLFLKGISNPKEFKSFKKNW